MTNYPVQPNEDEIATAAARVANQLLMNELDELVLYYAIPEYLVDSWKSLTFGSDVSTVDTVKLRILRDAMKTAIKEHKL